MKPSRSRNGSRGFTLIELMVTVALAVILMTIAVPSFLAFQRSSALSSTANSLVAAIAMARGEAMKSGSFAMVVPADGTTWSSGWVVFLDKDLDMAFDASKGDKVLFTQDALPSEMTISATGTAGAPAPYILFNGTGFPRTKESGFGSLTFSIASSPTDWNQIRRVIIFKTGRIRSCRPASASDDQCGGSSTT